MAKEKVLKNEEFGVKQPNEKKKLTLDIDIPDDDLILCKVCGHKNSKDLGMCAMCSNYLFK